MTDRARSRHLARNFGETPTSAPLRSRQAVDRDAALGSCGGHPLKPRPGSTRDLLFGTTARLVGRVGRARFPVSAPEWPRSLPREVPEPTLGVHYDTAWSRRYPARLARALILDTITRPVVRLVAAPIVGGTERLDGLDPPVIFAANHVSHADTPLLVACLPLPFRHRTVVAAAADYFFDRRWKAGLWSFLLAAVPIERSRVNRRSADLAAELVAGRWNLVIFPEGGRSPDGWGQPFRGGAAYLAARTGCPVVPVHLDGTRHLLPKGGGGLRRSPTAVTFGPPLRPRDGEDARRFSSRIEAAVTLLADEVNSDWWTARLRAATGASPDRTGPEASPWRRTWLLDRPSEGTRPSGRGPRTGWPWSSTGGARN